MRILERNLEKLRSSKLLRKADSVLTEKEIGQVLAAQLMSMTRNNELGYASTVSAQYSHLNDSGKKLMAELVDMMFIKAVELDKQRRQNDAEQLIMDNLKK